MTATATTATPTTATHQPTGTQASATTAAATVTAPTGDANAQQQLPRRAAPLQSWADTLHRYFTTAATTLAAHDEDPTAAKAAAFATALTGAVKFMGTFGERTGTPDEKPSAAARAAQQAAARGADIDEAMADAQCFDEDEHGRPAGGASGANSGGGVADAARRMERGNAAGALRSLMSFGIVQLAPGGPTANPALSALFPQRPDPPAPQPPSVLPLVLSEAQVMMAVEHANPHAAAGPRGDSNRGLQHYVNQHGVGALTPIIQAIANGQIPEGARKEIVHARGIPLRKAEGSDSIRPIAIPAVLRQITERVLRQLKDVRSKMAKVLTHEHLLGRQGGAETFASLRRTQLHANPRLVVASLDSRNAYNELDRGAILAGVREHVPELTRYAAFAYGSSSTVQFGARAGSSDSDVGNTPSVEITVAAGIAQGAAASGDFFCLGAASTLNALRGRHPNVQIDTLIDGVELLGELDAVTKCIEDYTAAAAEKLQLTLQPSKSVLYCPKPRSDAAFTAAAAKLGMQARTDDSPVDKQGVIIGGIPVGTPAFEHHVVNEAATTAVKRATDIASLATRRGKRTGPRSVTLLSAVQLLTLTVPGMITNLLRGVDTDATLGPARRVDDAVYGAFKAIMAIAEPRAIKTRARGRTAEAVSEASIRARFFLPSSLGGIGASSCVAAQAPARISCLTLTAAQHKARLPTTWLTHVNGAPGLSQWLTSHPAAAPSSPTHSGSSSSSGSGSSGSGSSGDSNGDPPTTALAALIAQGHTRQHVLTQRETTKRATALRTSLTTEAERRHHDSAAGTGTGSFLNAAPDKMTGMSDFAVRTALLWRLGIGHLHTQLVLQAITQAEATAATSRRHSAVHAKDARIDAFDAQVKLRPELDKQIEAMMLAATAPAGSTQPPPNAAYNALQQALAHCRGMDTRQRGKELAYTALAKRTPGPDGATVNCAVCHLRCDDDPEHPFTCGGDKQRGNHQVLVYKAVTDALTNIAKAVGAAVVQWRPQIDAHLEASTNPTRNADDAADARGSLLIQEAGKVPGTTGDKIVVLIRVYPHDDATSLASREAEIRAGAQAQWQLGDLKASNDAPLPAQPAARPSAALAVVTVSTTGATGPETQTLLRRLARIRAITTTGFTDQAVYAALIQRARQLLAASILTTNANLISTWQKSFKEQVNNATSRTAALISLIRAEEHAEAVARQQSAAAQTTHAAWLSELPPATRAALTTTPAAGGNAGGGGGGSTSGGHSAATTTAATTDTSSSSSSSNATDTITDNDTSNNVASLPLSTGDACTHAATPTQQSDIHDAAMHGATGDVNNSSSDSSSSSSSGTGDTSSDHNGATTTTTGATPTAAPVTLGDAGLARSVGLGYGGGAGLEHDAGLGYGSEPDAATAHGRVPTTHFDPGVHTSTPNAAPE